MNTSSPETKELPEKGKAPMAYITMPASVKAALGGIITYLAIFFTLSLLIALKQCNDCGYVWK